MIIALMSMALVLLFVILTVFLLYYFYSTFCWIQAHYSYSPLRPSKMPSCRHPVMRIQWVFIVGSIELLVRVSVHLNIFLFSLSLSLSLSLARKRIKTSITIHFALADGLQVRLGSERVAQSVKLMPSLLFSKI